MRQGWGTPVKPLAAGRRSFRLAWKGYQNYRLEICQGAEVEASFDLHSSEIERLVEALRDREFCVQPGICADCQKPIALPSNVCDDCMELYL